METKRIKINNIPSIIWGEKSSKVFIAVHGNMSNKEDKVIEILANKVTNKGYQLISFDLPEHGERKIDNNYLCKVQNCVNDLKQCLFLSPVVNMKIIIENMMLWSNTTEKELNEKQEIKTDFGQTLYWDYYLYVKENPITNWNKETYILYGNKDDMQNEDIIKNFSDNFNCKLTILKDGEHYFHTEKQLNCYKYWLDRIIK